MLIVHLIVECCFRVVYFCSSVGFWVILYIDYPKSYLETEQFKLKTRKLLYTQKKEEQFTFHPKFHQNGSKVSNYFLRWSRYVLRFIQNSKVFVITTPPPLAPPQNTKCFKLRDLLPSELWNMICLVVGFVQNSFNRMKYIQLNVRRVKRYNIQKIELYESTVEWTFSCDQLDRIKQTHQTSQFRTHFQFGMSLCEIDGASTLNSK